MTQFIETLHQIDGEFLIFLNSHHNAWADWFWFALSGKWIWAFLYLCMLISLIRTFGWKKAALFTLAITAVVVIADQTCASIIRPAVGRLRPSHPENPLSPYIMIVDNYRGGTFGFPSCHAANTFGVALITSLIFRKRTVTLCMYLWALANCYSRLYLGVHYPGDIIIGGIVGTLAAIASYYTASIVLTRYKAWFETSPKSHVCPKRPVCAYLSASRVIALALAATIAITAALAAIHTL